MGERVIVLGAGVAGLTAAHELIERGFEVTVYERRDIAGGKARSFPATITRMDPEGRLTREGSCLPAEHGFRFFPGFYRHVFDTMTRIPLSDGSGRHVINNRHDTQTLLLLQHDPGKPIIYPTQLWRLNALRTWRPRIMGPHLFRTNAGMSVADVWFFTRLVLRLLKSCPERRFAEYESQGWWEFSQAGHRDERYQGVMRAMTRLLVAARADELSVRTGGYIMLALGRAIVNWRGHRPKVLNGPTNKAWITPWCEYLEHKDVKFEFNTSVEGLRMSDGRIDEVIVSRNGQTCHDKAPWYVAALPFESMKKIVDECPGLEQADEQLGGLKDLKDRWMNGIMIYLRKDQKLVHGHTIYIDSPWALTSISQAAFWPGYDLADISKRQVRGILSIDISNWDDDGELIKKPAKECSSEEVFTEVCDQIRRHLEGTPYDGLFKPENIYGWCLDPDIRHPNPTHEFNLEPLLINTPCSWKSRPPAVTAVKNLFLAGDYVRTYTDLATMEAANESARRAVNGILKGSGSREKPCQVWPLAESLVLAPFRWLDRRSLRASASAEAWDWARRQLAELEQKEL